MNKQKKIAICGDFLGKRIAGIQRVAQEVVKELDKFANAGNLVLIAPNNAAEIPKYKNIKVILIHGDNGNTHFWIQWWYALYLIKHNLIGLTICNELPILKPGIAYLHDIYYKLYPQEFKTFSQKCSRAVVLCIYRCIAKRAKFIITVSNTSREEIMETYNVDKSRITVLGVGYQHILSILPDESIFEKNEDIIKGDYFFSLGGMSPRKNIRWIMEYAREHPNDVFVLSGRSSRYAGQVPNVKYLGYVSDAQAVALYKNCKAFIFPSIYEGFGIPPMEALALGAKVIVARSSCLPEIYEDTVYYIDAFNTKIDLNQLLETEVKRPEKVLEKYSWEYHGGGVYDIIKRFVN